MYPRVGVGVVLLTENRELLVGRRKGSHGAGQWALPGGALEWREDSFDCATREVFEETGLRLPKEASSFTSSSSKETHRWVDGIFDACECVIDENNHWITLFRVVCVASGDWKGKERTMEPEKCHGWRWMRASEILGEKNKNFFCDDVNDDQENAKAANVFEPLRKLLESGKLDDVVHFLL